MRVSSIALLTLLSLAALSAEASPSNRQTGLATYYGEGDGFHGRLTSSGTRFDKRGMTAAHPTLPMGSKVRVQNLENGRSVEVKITDRGPAPKPQARGVVIDLSHGAAAKIGLDHKRGKVPVRVESISR